MSEKPQVVAHETTDDMGEISGFGGGYEATCRAMLKAGMEWFDAHPDADPQFRGYKNIYGIITDDNDDVKALSKAVCDAADGDCTGAMHQAVIGRALYARKVGWEKYVEKCREHQKEKPE